VPNEGRPSPSTQITLDSDLMALHAVSPRQLAGFRTHVLLGAGYPTMHRTWVKPAKKRGLAKMNAVSMGSAHAFLFNWCKSWHPETDGQALGSSRQLAVSFRLQLAVPNKVHPSPSTQHCIGQLPVGTTICFTTRTCWVLDRLKQTCQVLAWCRISNHAFNVRETCNGKGLGRN